MQGSETQPEAEAEAQATPPSVQDDARPPHSVLPANLPPFLRPPFQKLGLRQKLKAKWRKKEQQHPDEQQFYQDELVQGVGDEEDEEATATSVLLSRHSRSSSRSDSHVDDQGDEGPDRWREVIRQKLRRSGRFVPMIGFHHILMFISLIAIIFLSLVVAGCSSQAMHDIYLLELSYVHPPVSSMGNGEEITSPSFYSLVANVSSTGHLAARVGYFGICMARNTDGQLTGWLCQSSVKILTAAINASNDPLNVLAIADNFRDQVILSMMIIISVILLFLSICIMATFPGWHEEVDDSGSEVEVRPFPSRPKTQLCMTFQALAALVLITAILWQHVAAVAQAATTEAAFGGTVTGGVGDVAMGLSWGALAANLLVVCGIGFMILNLRRRSGSVPGYDRLCREFHGNVAVTLIDFAHTGHGRLSKLTDGHALRDPNHLAQWLDGGLQKISTRYVLVEDIDTDLWFTLGGIFGIEPQFFLDHMNNLDISERDPSRHVQWNTWNLPLPYLTFRWYRPVSRAEHTKAATKAAIAATKPRRVVDEHKIIRLEEHYETDEKGKLQAFYTIHAARALSNIRRPEWDLSASSSTATKGLLAIEERVSIYRTMRNGYRYDAVPKAQTATWTEAGDIPKTPYVPPPSATLEEVDLYKGLVPRFPPNFNLGSIADVQKEYLDNLYNTHYSTMTCLEQNSDPYNQVSTLTPVPCGHSPLIHLFRIVESDTLGLLRLLDRVQKEIVQSTASEEAELEDILAMRKYIATALAHSSTLGRDLTGALGELLTLSRGSRKDPQHETVDKLSQQFEDTIQGLKEASSAITGTLQFIESHRAILEAESITRLTELAFLFIPLSFAASLFSMQIEQFTNPVPVTHFIAFALSLSATTYVLRALARSTWVHRQKQAYLTSIRTWRRIPPGASIPNRAVFPWLMSCLASQIKSLSQAKALKRLKKPKKPMWLALLVCFLIPVYVVIWTRDLGHGGVGLQVALTFLFIVFAATVYILAILG
ncbi:Ca2+ regulator and membrane fusion protein Fig1-domain-containing protein [Aspergillus multicolor]|uniref:Fig1 domain-containing protein n=1 Tax=Aspergillus multicolor TaxID=41759 RepID=UPI003CCDC34F